MLVHEKLTTSLLTVKVQVNWSRFAELAHNLNTQTHIHPVGRRERERRGVKQRSKKEREHEMRKNNDALINFSHNHQRNAKRYYNGVTRILKS